MKHIFTSAIACAMAVISIQAQLPKAYPCHAPALPQEQTAIIDAQGTPTYYRRTSLGWYIYAGGNNLQYGEIPGTSKIVWSENGDEAYIFNPLTADSRDSYIKCSVEGNKLVARFPQVLAVLDNATGTFPLYIGKLRPMVDENGLTYMPVSDPDDDIYTWTIQADGTVTMDHEPVALLPNGNFAGDVPRDILGTYYFQEGVNGEMEPFWNGVGDWAQTYDVVTVEPITPMPTDQTLEAWQMTSKKTTRMVDIAIDDDTIYMAHLTPYGDGALVGHIEGDKVVFPSLQNLGFSFQANANVYFVATIAVYGSYDFGDYVMEFLDHYEWKDAMVFNYDRQAKTLTPTQENQCILINSMKQGVSFYEYIEQPSFKYLTTVGMNAAPMDPQVVVPGRYDGFEDGYYLEFILPVKNINGVTLNTDRMYYNIYLNDEKMTFYTDQYRYLQDDVTDIPYDLADRNHDFTVLGETHVLQLHHEGINTIGIQSCFLGDDGVVYKSQLVTCTTSTGVDDVALESTIVNEDYYDLQGRPVDADDAHGIIIKRITYADGTVSTQKIIKQ